MILTRFRSLMIEGWTEVFAQKRTLARAIQQATALPLVCGRRMISRVICALGLQGRDWSAHYKLFSRSPWEEPGLFRPVVREYLARYRTGPITLAFDDTKTPKTGRHIPGASWQRDPMSPPFHVNLVFALRFLQVSLLFPHYREGAFSARAIPVRFEEAPVVKKPGKRATDAQRQAYRAAKKNQNLSVAAHAALEAVRAQFDAQGAADRRLLFVSDNSFCNRTMFRRPIDRVDLLARCRWDAKLCWPAPPGTARRYAVEKFTPEHVRQDQSIPWKEARVFFGGRWRTVRVKELNGVLWQRGALTQPLRLLITAPTPYQASPHGPRYYRDPACYLSTDTTGPLAVLAQAAFDRWQIEVNHREEKDILGVGDAQVRSPLSVPRHPAFQVALYSLIHLAGLLEYGPARTDDYLPLPKWRRKARRPSFLDLLSLLRKEILESSAPTPTIETIGAQDEPPAVDSRRPILAENVLVSAYT